MNKQPIPGDVLNFSREETITIPSSEKTKSMAIRNLDWERLKQKCKQAKNEVPKLSIFYSLLFGCTITSGLGIITNVISKDIPSWITIFYIFLFIFSLVFGCFLVWLDAKIHARKKSTLQEMEEDMNNIESLYKTELV